MSIIGTQQLYASLNEQYYIYNVIAEALNTLWKCKKRWYAILCLSQSQEVEKTTYKPPCLDLEVSFKYYHRSLY